MRRMVGLLVFAMIGLLIGCGNQDTLRPQAIQEGTKPTDVSTKAISKQTASLPSYDHVVVVVEENRPASAVYGSKNAPFINQLGANGATLTSVYAVAHPSQPNYLALFSGSTQGVTSDACPKTFHQPNLATILQSHRLTFGSFSEGLPTTGYRGCSYGTYARKHAPWVNFDNVSAKVQQPLSAFGTNYKRLPTVSFVIPNLDNDMHNGTVRQADDWLRNHFASYAAWSVAHNSLLIVTWDEDDTSGNNHIPTIIYGAHVRPGRFTEYTNHYRLLRTIEAFYNLPPISNERNSVPIAGIWKS